MSMILTDRLIDRSTGVCQRTFQSNKQTTINRANIIDRNLKLIELTFLITLVPQ